MTPLLHIAPPPSPDDEAVASTVAILDELLASARAGAVTEIVAVAWRGSSEPTIHMSTTDRIASLGAVRLAEHALVRQWLDGDVQP